MFVFILFFPIFPPVSLSWVVVAYNKNKNSAHLMCLHHKFLSKTVIYSFID